MKLTEKKIRDIAGRSGSRSGGGGGGGGVSASWVDENYLSKEFFSSLFKVYNGTDVAANEIEPNDELPTTTTNLNIKTFFDFWSAKGLSALGRSSGGGGGGVTLNTPLAQINGAGLGTPSNGQTLIYLNGAWTYGSASGGSISRITVTTPANSGLLVNGTNSGYITSSGTFALTFDTGYELIKPADYFDTNKNAKSALKLTTVSKKAWGRTYWSDNGVPTDISGDLDEVEDVTMLNGSRIYIQDSNDNQMSCVTLDGSNNLVFGENFDATTQYNTYLRGNNVFIQSGNQTNAVEVHADGTVEILISTAGIKIGNAYVVWDNQNSALKVTGANGAAINFYATGGVSALGYSS